jgi:hypothetical protein
LKNQQPAICFAKRATFNADLRQAQTSTRSMPP